MDAEKTGNFIKELRKEKNITQKQLADSLRVSDKAVSRWETGRGFPDINNLEDLSKALDVSIAEIINGEKITDNTDKEDLKKVTDDSFTIAKSLVNRKKWNNTIFGFLFGIIIFSIILIYLNSPEYIKDSKTAIRIETMSDGKVVAVLKEEVAGYEIYNRDDFGSYENLYFISCYKTKWNDLFGNKQEEIVSIGNIDSVNYIFYYPTEGADELIYLNNAGEFSGGIKTLPRLFYKVWIKIGVGLSTVGILAMIIYRKKYFIEKLFNFVMIPIIFTISEIIVFFGNFGEVYNAMRYFSEVAIVSVLIYALFILIVYFYRNKK